MNAAWISALVATTMALGVLAGALWRGGRRDGKIDAVLQQLTKLVEDHEARIRAVEHLPFGQRSRR